MELTQEQFDELFAKHSKKMVKIAVRLGFTREEGEDIAQDAFLLLLSKSEKFQEDHDNPAAFLYITQRNLIGDLLRRRKRWTSVPYSELSGTGILDTYFSSLKDNLLPGLSEADRDLLIAYFEEQASYQDISKRLGISEAQCRVKIFRAKKRYQKLFFKDKNNFHKGETNG